MSIDSSNDSTCKSEKSDSNVNCEERDYYNRIIDDLQEKSKIKIDAAYEKYRLDYELVKLLVVIEFNLVVHCKIKVNRILFSP